jgi:hypothetical protein
MLKFQLAVSGKRFLYSDLAYRTLYILSKQLHLCQEKGEYTLCQTNVPVGLYLRISM